MARTLKQQKALNQQLTWIGTVESLASHYDRPELAAALKTFGQDVLAGTVTWSDTIEDDEPDDVEGPSVLSDSHAPNMATLRTRAAVKDVRIAKRGDQYTLIDNQNEEVIGVATGLVELADKVDWIDTRSPREQAIAAGTVLGQFDDHVPGCDLAEARSATCTC